jgi:hypothetical protein
MPTRSDVRPWRQLLPGILIIVVAVVAVWFLSTAAVVGSGGPFPGLTHPTPKVSTEVGRGGKP